MKKIIILLLMATILNSCVRSLYPLTENEKEMIFKKELLGKWKPINENAEYIIDTLNGSQGKTYTVMIIERDLGKKTIDTSNFLMTLVNIKGQYFLDCIPDPSYLDYPNLSDLTRPLFIVSHFFIKIHSIGKNMVTMSVIENDALFRLLKTNKIKMEYKIINDDEILLLDKTKVLRQKLIELEKFTSVYKKKDSLVRINK